MNSKHKIIIFSLLMGVSFCLIGLNQKVEAQSLKEQFKPEKISMSTKSDSNTTLLGVWENEIVKGAQGLVVNENYLYLLNKNNGLYILDVNNPANPVLKDSCLLSDYSRCLTLMGDYAYIGNEGLRVIDIHDPSNPVETGHYDTGGGRENDIAVQGNYAYIADTDNHLYIVDVNDKSNPYLKGEYDAGTDLTAIDVEGDYAYIGIDYSSNNAVEREFRVIDVSNPENPTEIGKYDGWWGWSSLPAGGNRPITSISAEGTYLYVINHFMGLGVFNVSDPQNPAETGFYHGYNGSVYDLSIEGNFAYVSDYDCKIIDISNPSAPMLSGYYTLDYDHYYVPENSVQDGIIYIAAENLFIIQNNLVTGIRKSNVLEPHNFVLKQNYPNPFNPTTTIRYTITAVAVGTLFMKFVKLKVYDVLGNEIETLVNEDKPVGKYEVEFDASSLSSGVYYYKIQAGDFVQTKKMILLK